MSVALNLLIIAATIVGLWFGAVWVVEAATRIARRLGISELIIGLTVVAIGTSAPEFAVTSVAAMQGQADISVGNVVGSNIFNLGFILGGLALVRGIPTTRKLVFRDGGVLIGATLVLVLFLWDLTMQWWEGVILLVGLVTYITYLITRREVLEEDIPEGEFNWLDVPRFLLGVAVVVASGHFLVEAASELARHYGVSDWVIAVTIVAFGTSAPEIATSAVALFKGHHDISAGNLIGSDLFNLLGVLGLAALMQPLTVDVGARGSVLLLSGMVILVVVMMRTGWRLSRWEGGLLLAINVVRWVLDFAR